MSLKLIKRRLLKLKTFYSRRLNTYYLLLRRLSRSFLFHKSLSRKTPYAMALAFNMPPFRNYPRFFYFLMGLFNFQFRPRLITGSWGPRARGRRRRLWFYLRKLGAQSPNTLLSRLRPPRLIWRTGSLHANFHSISVRHFMHRRIRRGLWRLRMRKYRRRYMQTLG